MTEPTDSKLYLKVKTKIISEYPKNSAYRSGMIVKKYKNMFYKKHKTRKAYSGNKNRSTLKRWFKEKWTNQRGEVGYAKMGDLYRPTIKINKNTPKTWNEIPRKKIRKFQTEKRITGRVSHFD